jgi:hypothetical protein
LCGFRADGKIATVTPILFFPGKERPVPGDPNVRIRYFQSGFGWMGNWDKQITNITEFRVIAE